MPPKKAADGPVPPNRLPPSECQGPHPAELWSRPDRAVGAAREHRVDGGGAAEHRTGLGGDGAAQGGPVTPPGARAGGEPERVVGALAEQDDAGAVEEPGHRAGNLPVAHLRSSSGLCLGPDRAVGSGIEVDRPIPPATTAGETPAAGGSGAAEAAVAEAVARPTAASDATSPVARRPLHRTAGGPDTTGGRAWPLFRIDRMDAPSCLIAIPVFRWNDQPPEIRQTSGIQPTRPLWNRYERKCKNEVPNWLYAMLPTPDVSVCVRRTIRPPALRLRRWPGSEPRPSSSHPLPASSRSVPLSGGRTVRQRVKITQRRP